MVSDIAFDSMITRIIPDEEIHKLMSTFKITDYKIDNESNTFTVKKGQAVLPDKELSIRERRFAESQNLYNKE